MIKYRTRTRIPPPIPPDRIYKIGITGGMGAGKSVIAAALSGVTGYPLFKADDAARNLMDNDPEIRKEVTRVFSSKVMKAGGLIDRKALAEIVFNDPEKLKHLNSIIHPATAYAFEKWYRAQFKLKHPPKGIIKEAAILFETGTHADLDFIIYVYAPKEVRIARAGNRDGISREDALSRMNRQWSEERKMAMSDWVVRNYAPYQMLETIFDVPERLMKSLKARNMPYFK